MRKERTKSKRLTNLAHAHMRRGLQEIMVTARFTNTLLVVGILTSTCLESAPLTCHRQSTEGLVESSVLCTRVIENRKRRAKIVLQTSPALLVVNRVAQRLPQFDLHGNVAFFGEK
ncbi:hypothetical protein EV356DRAFT_499061 [Viridothelium virens]|uniref:Uncharacterized protein n=1 Tax=Viridothelium virens TaxID=1048519 RepID=A0A6A6HDA1_VIRVR|nr:hypothetical protein EV356DRAFT_499061 [Viridothelium virens]